MEQPPKILTATLNDLYLDPKNPRLGRHNIDKKLGQNAILELIKDWSLEELAVSMLESGYWPQEALIVIDEEIPGKKGPVHVVVEGNRRLAALKLIVRARARKRRFRSVARAD